MSRRRALLIGLALSFAAAPFIFGIESWPLTRYPMFSERVTFPVRVVGAWIGPSLERACPVPRRWLSPDRITVLVERFRAPAEGANENLARFFRSVRERARLVDPESDPCLKGQARDGRKLFVVETEADAEGRRSRKVLYAADL